MHWPLFSVCWGDNSCVCWFLASQFTLELHPTRNGRLSQQHVWLFPALVIYTQPCHWAKVGKLRAKLITQTLSRDIHTKATQWSKFWVYLRSFFLCNLDHTWPFFLQFEGRWQLFLICWLFDSNDLLKRCTQLSVVQCCLSIRNINLTSSS